MVKLIFIFIFIGLFTRTYSQDSVYIRNTINTLASKEFNGRGYVNKGDKIAAKFIQKELKRHGVLPVVKNYSQRVSFPINTFPSAMQLSLDGTELAPVDEYLVSPNCPTTSGKYTILYLPEAADTVDAIFDSITQINYNNQFVVAPFKKRKLARENPIKAAGVIVPKKSFYWWASTAFEVASTPLIVVKDSIINQRPSTINVEIKNKFYKNYHSQNLIGIIPGTEQADSFIVFTAHYDHLGTMGNENIFVGANDNASGTTMVLSLAKYFGTSTNKPKYTTVFLFFTGEEAGLIGSKYFVQNPLIDLSKIKALINLDMVGSGSEGIALVNGKNTPWITSRIESINTEKGYLPDIKIRGKSCNSDHCFFHKAGVPAVFIYTRGKEHKAYHNLKDSPQNLPLTKFNELFKLLVEFSEK